MSKNRTNRQRAARTLAARSDLSYAAALELLRSVAEIPDLDDPAALAALLATRPATSGEHAAVLADRYDVTITDDIGHSRDVLDTVELWPDMVAAITAAPDAVTWSGQTDGSTWTVHPAWAAGLGGDVTWADADGEFELTGGGFGNPGCDGCGTYDAVVRVGRTYLCATGAAALEEGSAEPAPHCRFCHRPAGADYHLAGVVPADENQVVCDGCWDERLR